MVCSDQIPDDLDDESFFQDRDVLQKRGINATDIKKLKTAGICTVKGVQMTTRKRLRYERNIRGESGENKGSSL